jgi:hypothetical protein
MGNAACDRNVGVAETTVRRAMADAQFGDLARSARGGVLVALATGLRVVEWAQPVGDVFYRVEGRLIGVVGRIIDHAISPARAANIVL